MENLNVHERVRLYMKKSKAYNKKLEQAFKLAITKELYPKKCLACYIAGLRWCIYWDQNCNCEEYETGMVEDIAKQFLHGL